MEVLLSLDAWAPKPIRLRGRSCVISVYGRDPPLSGSPTAITFLRRWNIFGFAHRLPFAYLSSRQLNLSHTKHFTASHISFPVQSDPSKACRFPCTSTNCIFGFPQSSIPFFHIPFFIFWVDFTFGYTPSLFPFYPVVCIMSCGIGPFHFHIFSICMREQEIGAEFFSAMRAGLIGRMKG